MGSGGSQPLMVLSDLPSAWSGYDQFSQLYQQAVTLIREIGAANKSWAGTDPTGVAYTQQVGKQTQGVEDFIKQIGDDFRDIGISGDWTSKTFADADESNTQAVGG
jgi:hypothetical protein